LRGKAGAPRPRADRGGPLGGRRRLRSGDRGGPVDVRAPAPVPGWDRDRHRERRRRRRGRPVHRRTRREGAPARGELIGAGSIPVVHLVPRARRRPRRQGGKEPDVRMLQKLLCTVLLVAFVTPPAGAQLRLPRPVGYVNDFANVLSAQDEARIGAVIEEVRAKSGGEIVVVTLPSLEGRTRDEVALQIGREWRIGRRGEPGDPARNTGVVVLVVPRETSPDGRGHLKIETGLGTTTFI